MAPKKKTKYTPKTASFLRRDLNARQKTKEFLLKFQVPNSEVLDGQVIINLMPCTFTGPKMFWAGPNFMCQTKKIFTYCGSPKHDLHQ
jgi:hypothetical protein